MQRLRSSVPPGCDGSLVLSKQCPFGILEGAPFQSERALFTNDFAHSMFDTDYDLYLRIGLTYKF